MPRLAGALTVLLVLLVAAPARAFFHLAVIDGQLLGEAHGGALAR